MICPKTNSDEKTEELKFQTDAMLSRFDTIVHNLRILGLHISRLLVPFPAPTTSKSDEEDQNQDSAISNFLKSLQLNDRNDLNRTFAIRFLYPKKFNVERALRTFHEHERMRRKEGLDKVWINEPCIVKEVMSSKLTILPFHENCPLILLLNASLHIPKQVPLLLALRALICQLDTSMELHPDACRMGIIFIYNMSDSKYENFDYAFGQKIMKLLKEAYPASLKAVYVVSAPSWFQAVYKVNFVTNEEILEILTKLLPSEYIPASFGGKYHVSNQEGWFKKCVQTLTNPTKFYFAKYYSATKPAGYRKSVEKSNVTNKQLLQSDFKGLMSSRKKSVDVHSRASSREMRTSQFHNMKKTKMKDFILSLKEKQSWNSFSTEYNEVNKLSSENRKNYATTAFKNHMNAHKNRYLDIVCFDHTRVILTDSLDGCDYIHANFIDGPTQPRAFISTQGPLETTFTDFWQMVWEQQVTSIVMVTRTYEQHTMKCGQYWPLNHKEQLYVGDSFLVENITNEKTMDEYQQMCGVPNFIDILFSALRIKNLNSTTNEKERIVFHFQFTGWPDYGVPQQSDSILNLRDAVKNIQAMKQSEDLPKYSMLPPVVVHCSAGIGRTGTYCTIDICLGSLEDSIKRMGPDADPLEAELLSIPDIVLTLRSQRAHSVQNAEQYAYCYETVFRYVTTRLSVETRNKIMSILSDMI